MDAESYQHCQKTFGEFTQEEYIRAFNPIAARVKEQQGCQSLIFFIRENAFLLFP